MISYVDSHCHLTSEKYGAGTVASEAIDTLLTEAVAAGVKMFGLAGVESREWPKQLALVQKYPSLLISHFGLHPWWVESFSAQEVSCELEKLAASLPLAHGLGETGLDHGPKRNPERFLAQNNAFQAQIDLALQFQKPLVLHIVHAHEAALKILKDRNAERVPLICHSYSGNVTILEKYLKLGAFISYNGSIARETGYESVKKSLLRTPLNRILFETDSPDQGENRSELNHPKNVVRTYEVAARALQVDLSELSERVFKNFSGIYGLQETIE